MNIDSIDSLIRRCRRALRHGLLTARAVWLAGNIPSVRPYIQGFVAAFADVAQDAGDEDAAAHLRHATIRLRPLAKLTPEEAERDACATLSLMNRRWPAVYRGLIEHWAAHLDADK